MTSVAQRFRGKEATEYEPQTWSGEKGSESITAFKMELQNWAGSLRDNMMKVMHVAEERESRLMELYKIHTCVHGHQECKNVARKRLYQVLVSRQKRSEERRRNPEISIQGDNSSVISIRGRVQTGLLHTLECLSR